MSAFVILAATLPIILLVLVAGCIMIISVVRANKDDLVALANVFAECLVDLTERVVRAQREVRTTTGLGLEPPAAEPAPSMGEDA